jgi:hypothetical protein
MVDVSPVDYSTAIGRVRKYIPDVIQLPDPADPDGPVSYMWSDDAIDSFIADEWHDIDNPIHGYEIKRAAAYLMIATANNENLILKKIKTEDLETDGAAVADKLIKAAQELLRQAHLESFDLESEIFINVPYYPTPPRYDWR